MLKEFLAPFRDRVLVDLDTPEASKLARDFFAEYLVAHRLFVPEDAPDPAPTADGKAMRVELLSSRRVARIATWLAPLLSPQAIVAFAAAGIAWLVLSAPSSLLRSRYADNVALSLRELAILAGLVVAMALFHEIGHATACRRFSGFAGPVSFSLFFGIPTFSVDVSTVSRLRRRERVAVALSGVYFQGIAIALLSLAFRDWTHVGVFVNLGLISIAVNLVPLYRNDGYWALSDALGRDLSLDVARLRDGWVERLYFVWMHAMLIVIVASVFQFCLHVVPATIDALSDVEIERRVIGLSLLSLNVAFAVVFAVMTVRDRVLALLRFRHAPC